MKLPPSCNLQLNCSSSSLKNSLSSKSPMAADYTATRPMACIFYQDDDSLPWCSFWGPTTISDPILHVDDNTDDPLPVCASSRGFTLSRDSHSNYYIGNPFPSDNQPRHCGPLGHPPTHHPPDDTDVVLAVHRPWRMSKLLFHIICAIRRGPRIYDFDTYSSNTQQWISRTRINLQREIVPNTGVSCGRFAFWLTQPRRSVLRFDITGNTNSEIISFLELPQGIPPAEQVRMQLGRAGDMLGLVIVNEAASTVELYSRSVVDGSSWSEPDVFNVEIEAATASPDARREEKLMNLVLREMPWPLRFESCKMDAMLWVAGTTVMLDCRNSDPRNRMYAMGVFSLEEPASIVDGVPHVCTHLLPSAFDWGWIQFN